jgi:hypothetical protein
MTIFREDWRQQSHKCEKCGWEGTAETAGVGTMYRKKFLDLYCPSCREFLDLIIFPDDAGCGREAEYLSNEQKEAKAEAERQHAEYLRQCLKTADQLPDLPAGDLIFKWDQVQGETWITAGENVVWKEPVTYEGFERFERIALVLKEKYGSRAKDLAPTDRSMLFLYGDYLPAVLNVRKVRQDLFGVSVDLDPSI